MGGIFMNWRARLRGKVKSFQNDQRGSVTIQVIFFSLLLLGTTGVVLDSGRVYDAHTQMQAYADQMALAAANELDGQDDAIQRATNAVFGLSGSDPFLSKSGLNGDDFSVESLTFYASMAASEKPQNDFTEAFPRNNVLATATSTSPIFSNDPVADSNAALFAVVKVNQKNLPSAMFNIMNIVSTRKGATEVGGTGNNFDENIEFSAVAAASMDRTTCADLSTLVFCNPWENEATNELEVDKADSAYSVPGRSLMTFAPNFSGLSLSEQPVIDGTTHGSLYPYNVEHQIFRLTNPVADPSGVCSVDFLLALATESAGSESSADYLKARDRCLMARARSETVCWGPGDELAIAPADGDMVSRALNTAFDIWHEPFDTAISNNVPITGTGLTRATFYEPDQVATTTYESADRFGPDGPDTGPYTAQDGIADYDLFGLADPFEFHYDTVPIGGHSMLTRVHGAGIGYDVCHANTYSKYATSTANGGECAIDFVGNHHQGNSGTTNVTRGRLQHFWSNMYGLNPRSPAGQLPTEITTWYELYKLEKERFATLTTNGSLSRIHEYSTGATSPAGFETEDNVTNYGLTTAFDKYVKHGPDDFFARSGSTVLLNPGYERRRVRSAMVNCSATTASGLNSDGTYDVHPDDIHVLDVYIPAPPGHFCGANEIGCDLEDSIETRMFVELIDDVTDDVFLNRFTVQLVR